MTSGELCTPEQQRWRVKVRENFSDRLAEGESPSGRAGTLFLFLPPLTALLSSLTAMKTPLNGLTTKHTTYWHDNKNREKL